MRFPTLVLHLNQNASCPSVIALICCFCQAFSQSDIVICVMVCKCYVYTVVCVFGYYSEFKLVRVDLMSSQDHTLCMFLIHTFTTTSTAQSRPHHSTFVCQSPTIKLFVNTPLVLSLFMKTFIPLALFASIKSLHQRLALFIWWKKKKQKGRRRK